MQDVADQSVAPTTIGADLCAIFVSLELSRSTWLATSLSPGRGEKMSKHSVSAGDIAALLARFSELRKKACARTGDEDRRRVCRERKVLIMERVQHVNRIKGLLFSQGASGYEPLRRDRRARLDALQTGDGRRLPQHLKAQVCRELDRLELLLEQIKAAEAECGALIADSRLGVDARRPYRKRLANHPPRRPRNAGG
jgi:transposase